MMRALSAHPDLTPELVSDAIPVCTWTIVSNFGALLRLEEDLTCINMPKRPESAKIVKEFMLLEGEHKVKPWKAGQPMRVERDAGDSDDDFLKKELNLEALVMDEAIKIQIEISKKPHSKDIFRTATLLNYHTGYWGPTSAPSEARARKETTSVAIAEFCTINEEDEETPTTSKSQAVRSNVATILENLVKVVSSLLNRYIYADLLYLQTLVDNAYEHRVKSLDVEMADADTDKDEDEDQNDKQKDSTKKPGGTEEDRLKFTFLHTVQGWNQDDKDEIGDNPVAVKNHATSISCLFSASETKNRLSTLGQIIEAQSSHMTIVAGSNKKQATSQDEVDYAPTTPIAIKNTIDDIAPHEKPRSRSVPSAPSPTPPVVVPVPQSTSRPSPVTRSNKGQGKAKRIDDPSSRQKRVPPPSINEDVISPGRRPSVKKRPRLNTAGERTGLSRLSSDDDDLHADADAAAADTDTEDDENAIDLAISSLSQP
ncbi:hypothetical protein JVT61DRAFT_9065 [Boletus reticuloceps]|uniref:Uncharacterized protein n=1 Tax=Boletus reticuloceps TaxID=495285 RepID=A0A8I3A6P9_9AGAM|nr:hypothetical protein JVT61DRAFT_9065 [Boletus reticuloceps]